MGRMSRSSTSHFNLHQLAARPGGGTPPCGRTRWSPDRGKSMAVQGGSPRWRHTDDQRQLGRPRSPTNTAIGSAPSGSGTRPWRRRTPARTLAAASGARQFDEGADARPAPLLLPPVLGKQYCKDAHRQARLTAEDTLLQTALEVGLD